jgi:hypothetical protein
MPKIVPSQELDAIEAIVNAHPEGVNGATIQNQLEFKLPPRQFQRRLAKLAEQKRITTEGRGRGRIYRPIDRLSDSVQASGVQAKAEVGSVKVETYPPPSEKAKEIKQAVTTPEAARKPVGYNRDLLDQYRPNETYYLSAEIREQLHEKGKPPNAGQPAGTYVKTVYNRLLIDLSWNSSRLEGNTYSLLETERLIELGESANNKDAREAQMILNHREAIDLIVEGIDEIGVNRHTILNLHGLLSDNLLPNPAASGRLRTIEVGISGSVFVPLAVPQQIEELFTQVLDTAAAIKDPFEQALFLIIHLPYLQPFEDVNKRVSRLAANIPLIRANLSPLSYVDVPEQAYAHGLLGVYELNRTELIRDVFIWAYERSCARYSAVRQSLGDPDPMKLRYRTEITEVVGYVVKNVMDKTEAVRHIKQFAEQWIGTENRKLFVEVCETELSNLHEGKIAKFRVKPSEYQAWQQSWT